MDDYTKRKNTESEENYTLSLDLVQKFLLFPESTFLTKVMVL